MNDPLDSGPEGGLYRPPPLNLRRLHQTNKTAAPLRYISDQVHGGAGSISALLVISTRTSLRDGNSEESLHHRLWELVSVRGSARSFGLSRAGKSGARRGHYPARLAAASQLSVTVQPAC